MEPDTRTVVVCLRSMDMNDRLKALVTGSVELATIVETAREEGFVALSEIAINKMLEGVTTYEEVVAMTG